MFKKNMQPLRLPTTAIAQKDKKVAKEMKNKANPYEGKRLVQVDKTTSTYVPANATKEEVNAIIEQVRKNIAAHKLPLKGGIK